MYRRLDLASARLFKRWDLGVAQFDVLAHVGAEEGMTQQRLANSLLVTKGNVVQVLDRMEKRGLLVRRQYGRSNRLYLTEKGRRIFDEVVPAQEAMITERFSVLSQSEQTQLHELLRKLDRRLDKYER